MAGRPESDALQGLTRCVRLVNDLARIERMVPMLGAKRYENDVEHSYQLALTAWYLLATRNLDLDIQKVLTYALAHDLVEVYAGDTYIYSKDETLIAGKKEREAAAAKRLAQEFAEFSQLHEAIADYERREDRESRFVYALDKVLPLIQIREDGGRAWKEGGVTLDMLIAHKTPKVALSPEVEPYFNELVALLREEKITA